MDPTLERLNERTEKVANRLLRDVKERRFSGFFIGNRKELKEEILFLLGKIKETEADIQMASQSLEGLLSMYGYPEEAQEIRILRCDAQGNLRDYPPVNGGEREPSVEKIVTDLLVAEEESPVEERQKLHAEFEVRRLEEMREDIDKKLERYRGGSDEI